MPDWADIMAAEWMDVIKSVYKVKDIETNRVHHPIVAKQGQQFSKGIDSSFGKIDFDSPDYYMREVLKKNAWQFSVAKNYQDTIRLNNLLIREDGSLRPWHDFKYEAQKIVGDSIKYLKTEYNTIVSAAQMSRLWAEIQRDKEIFPYVQMVVVKDGRTSDICEPLADVIFRVDDPVLMYYFPPNHFNCRTTVKKLRYGVPTDKYELPEIPEAFQNNVGATGEVFTKDNAYIANTPTNLLSDLDYVENQKVQVSTKAEKWSTSENERKRQKVEYRQRLETAKALKDYFNEEVKILPEILPNHWSYKHHFDNAPIANKVTDIKVGRTYWEMESYEGKFRIGKISSMIKHGQEQAKHVVLKLNHKVEFNRVIEQIKSLEKQDDFNFKAEEVIVISKEGQVIYHYKKDRP